MTSFFEFDLFLALELYFRDSNLYIEKTCSRLISSFCNSTSRKLAYTRDLIEEARSKDSIINLFERFVEL